MCEQRQRIICRRNSTKASAKRSTSKHCKRMSQYRSIFWKKRSNGYETTTTTKRFGKKSRSRQSGTKNGSEKESNSEQVRYVGRASGTPGSGSCENRQNNVTQQKMPLSTRNDGL